MNNFNKINRTIFKIIKQYYIDNTCTCIQRLYVYSDPVNNFLMSAEDITEHVIKCASFHVVFNAICIIWNS